MLRAQENSAQIILREKEFSDLERGTVQRWEGFRAEPRLQLSDVIKDLIVPISPALVLASSLAYPPSWLPGGRKHLKIHMQRQHVCITFEANCLHFSSD